MKQFTVNGHTYKLDAISASEALDFGLEAVEAITPLIGGLNQLKEADFEGKIMSEKGLQILASLASGYNAAKIKPVFRKAINYVITDKDEYLRDVGVFERHFTQENPEGLLIVPLMATWEIARPFLPSWLPTMLQNASLKAKSILSPSNTPPTGGK